MLGQLQQALVSVCLRLTLFTCLTRVSPEQIVVLLVASGSRAHHFAVKVSEARALVPGEQVAGQDDFDRSLVTAELVDNFSVKYRVLWSSLSSVTDNLSKCPPCLFQIRVLATPLDEQDRLTV